MAEKRHFGNCRNVWGHSKLKGELVLENIYEIQRNIVLEKLLDN